MRATRAHPSHTESLAEAARGAFEGPKSTEEAPREVRGSARVDFVPIWGRFEGVRSVWRIGRGGSRSTFVEIDFFSPSERLGLDFAPPRPASRGILTLLGRSLGAPGRSLGSPVGPAGAFWDSSGAALARLVALLGALGRPWASRWLSWRSGNRFGVDLGPMFGRFRSDFAWIFRCSVLATVLSLRSVFFFRWLARDDRS